MISPIDIRVSAATDNAVSLAAAKAHSRKSRAAHIRTAGSPHPTEKAAGSASRTAVPSSVQNLGVVRTLGDAGQAAAATLQASLLIQTKPQLALDAQANTSYQSVAPLLQ